jgi:hypothetical protein
VPYSGVFAIITLMAMIAESRSGLVEQAFETAMKKH